MGLRLRHMIVSVGDKEGFLYATPGETWLCMKVEVNGHRLELRRPFPRDDFGSLFELIARQMIEEIKIAAQKLKDGASARELL